MWTVCYNQIMFIQLFLLILGIIFITILLIKYLLLGNKLFSKLERSVPFFFPTFDKKLGVVILVFTVAVFLLLVYLSKTYGFDSIPVEIVSWIFSIILIIFVLKYGKAPK